MIRHGIFKEILGMAFDSLWAHKLRSFLTLLGILIGVMTVIGMVSIIQGLNGSFRKELQSAGSDLVMVRKYDPVMMGRLTDEEFDRLREHAPYGHRLLVKGKASEIALNVARHHHERADGHADADLLGPLGDRDQHDVHDDDAADEKGDGGDADHGEIDARGGCFIELDEGLGCPVGEIVGLSEGVLAGAA